MSGSTKFVPHPYQERAIQDLIADPRHALFMEPGLGKTAIVLETFRRLREACDVARMLVVAPLRVCYCTWPDEIAKWGFDFRVVNLHERPALENSVNAADIFLVNPEGLPRLLGRPNEKRTRWIPGLWQRWKSRPEMLVVDELTKFKRASGVRARTLKRVLGDFGRRVGMTGTPAPNGLLDLHGQLLVIDRGEALDPRVTHYKRQFFVPVGDPRRQIWEPRPGSAEQITALIAPRITRLDARDYLNLPKRVVTEVPVVLPDYAMGIYRSMRDDGATLLADEIEVFSGEDSAAVKCRQIANGVVYTASPLESHREFAVVHDAKLEALKDLLEEIGRPTIVVYEFRHEAELIEKAVPGVSVIGGGTSPRGARRSAEDWNAGHVPVLLIHPAAGGVGLNLQQGGNAMIWYSPPWDLEQLEQTIGRLERQGQPEPNVFVYFLVARNTIDKRVVRVLQSKAATQAALLDALKEEFDHE